MASKFAMGRRLELVGLGVFVALVGVGYLAGQEAPAGTLAELLSKDLVEQEMVPIPAGDLVMGIKGDADDNPTQAAHIDAFFPDRYEVTNTQ